MYRTDSLGGEAQAPAWQEGEPAAPQPFEPQVDGAYNGGGLSQAENASTHRTARPELRSQPVARLDLLSRTFQVRIKRAIDVAVAGLGLVVLSPLLIAISIAIQLDSPGSPIFWQIRWGKNQKKVRIYKFRTMRADLSDRSGIAQTVPNDFRLTRLGAFLRKSNLDELPQLFNILIGDMSLVGPRCHPIGMLAAGMLYEELVPSYHRRHAVLPGLTGLAQANGYRGPTVDPVAAKMRIALDLQYVDRFSLWLDLQIVALTLWREVRRKGNGL